MSHSPDRRLLLRIGQHPEALSQSIRRHPRPCQRARCQRPIPLPWRWNAKPHQASVPPWAGLSTYEGNGALVTLRTEVTCDPIRFWGGNCAAPSSRQTMALRRKSCLRDSRAEGRDVDFVAEFAQGSRQSPARCRRALGSRSPPCSTVSGYWELKRKFRLKGTGHRRLRPERLLKGIGRMARPNPSTPRKTAKRTWLFVARMPVTSLFFALLSRRREREEWLRRRPLSGTRGYPRFA